MASATSGLIGDVNAVERVHRDVDAIGQPALDRVRGDLDHLGGQISLGGTEGRQDVARGLAGAPDPDAQPVELIATERLDDVAQAIVAAGRARAPEADLAERQIDVVGDDEQVGGGVDVGLAQGGAQRGAGAVHVAHRLDEQDTTRGFRTPGFEDGRTVPQSPLPRELPPTGQEVDDAEADVVPGEPIAVAGIAQPADGFHAADRTRAGGGRGSLSSRAMDQAPDHRRAAPRGADVVVIGGGIIGCAAAAMMADRGARVVLVEQTAVGAGASGRNLGAVQHPFDPVLAPLHVESLARYQALAARSDGAFAIGRRPAGLLLLNHDPEAAAAQAERLAGTYPELEPKLIPDHELLELEPSLAPGPSAVWLATGYPIPPSSATTAWASMAEERGAHLVLGAAARPVIDGDRARRVVLDDGSAIAADAILVAAGPWSGALIDASGSWNRIQPTYGVTVQLRLDGHAPRHILEEDDVDGVNRAAAATARAAAVTDDDTDPPSLFSMASAGGLSTVGSTFLPAEPDAARVSPLLLRRAAAYLPAVAEAEVVGRRMCARPQSVDGRPFIGPVNDVDGLFVCAGHGPWGISTGPASAAIVARSILDGTAPPPELEASRAV
jgi:glycine/D-amino acid oxidase-like deaminating enzyme